MPILLSSRSIKFAFSMKISLSIISIILLLFYGNQGIAQSQFKKNAVQKISLKQGDLLFLDLDCGPLCDAIESVTTSFGNNSFSHMGIYFVRNDSGLVVEAIGSNVRITPISKFIGYSKKPAFVGRLKFQTLISKAILFAISKVGMPYDDEFIYGNGKYYCSELVYEAFAYSNNGTPVFELKPMTYKLEGTNNFNPAWVAYFNGLGKNIPEGLPGCNPGGISLSENIEMIGSYP